MEKPLKEGFHVNRCRPWNSAGRYHYECKECANKRWGRMTTEAKRTKVKWNNDRARGKRVYTVVSDPSGTYPKGGRFEAHDFRHSLLAGAWPVGMVVYREWDKKEYVVGVRREGLDPVNAV